MISVSRRAFFQALFVALLVSAVSLPGLAQNAPGKQLTVERIFSAPSLSGHLARGLEWTPDGRRISFIEGFGDSAELWTMDASTGEKKQLLDAAALKSVTQPEKEKSVQSTGLGRIQAENYSWAPDGNSLLFIGSSDLVLLDLSTKSVKPLVSGDADLEDPKFSPDGKWISFVRDSNLWIVSTAGGDAKALTTGGSEEILKGQLDWVYPEELDCTTAYWWSPDSSKIAYYEMDERPVTRYPIMDMSSPTGAMDYTRYPQAGEANPIVRVGVVSLSAGQTTWMDTGANTDVYLPRVNWLPNSQSVAIQRLNRAQTQLDLLLADAQSGKSNSILTETDPYWINVSDDLFFFSDSRRFLWSSERTGYRHLYLYDVSGKLLDTLTSGNWSVASTGGFGPESNSPPAVDEKQGYVYFPSAKDDDTGIQIYRLSLKDKSMRRITPTQGVHETSFAPGAAGFVDTFSDSSAPPRQDLFRADGARVTVLSENKVPELADYHLSPTEFVTVSATDGTPLRAKMIKPPDFDPSKKYPVLIDVYGGPHVQQVVNAWEGASYLWFQMIAQHGYIIFTLDNRGSAGRGHAFETPIYHHLGKIELQDQLAGVQYLKSLPYVDSSRIGIWGWSYGGFMTLTALFHAPDVFKIGVSVAPVSDWKLYDTIYTERYMGRPQDNPDGYKDSSPVNFAANLAGRLMLIHSTGDDNVHFANTAEVLNELIDNGKYPANLLLFPGRGHGISDRPARLLLFERMASFIFDNL
jgi:dipeptidyl-peptidase 4